MPSSEAAAERRVAKAQQMGAALPPVEHDPLPCPRCESINTKFCYYNNYNFSQPRHFCKSCRRYWTHGGTLRDIPVGGGSRKTAKRSRTSSSTSNSATSSYSSAGSHHHHQQQHAQQLMLHEPIPATPVFVSLSSPSPINAVNGGGGGSGGGGGGFTSLLSSAGPGILSLGGFGLGFEEVGFGLGRGVWAFPDMGYVSSGGMGGGGGGGGVGGANGGDGEECGGGMSREDTWQVGSGESGFGVGVGGDCFTSLPELAISTPGSGRN